MGYCSDAQVRAMEAGERVAFSWGAFSPRAEKAQRDAAVRQKAREARMDRGPHLANDGVTLVIPSQVYNKEAAAFWKAQGFRWCAEWKTWERDTRTPSQDKRYTAAAWLEAAQRKYAEFWPEWQGTEVA